MKAAGRWAVGVSLLAVLGLAGVARAEEAGAYWPQWRGPLATGVAQQADPPIEWSETRNIRWKVAIPGHGHSSPIVWEDRIFLTTAVETDKAVSEDEIRAVRDRTPSWHRRNARLPGKVLQFVVMAINRADGKVLWSRVVREAAPHTATHADGSWASGSPVTDGQRVYAYFGSYGLHALDLQGEVQWQKDFGLLQTKASFGEGTSPVLCGESILLCQDQEGPSFIVAMDRRTGEELWRRPRDEDTSWATPLVVEAGGRRQIVTSATNRIRAYDAATGEELWHATGMTGNVVPSPVSDGRNVYCMSGFRGNAVMAIRLAEASGDVNAQPGAIAWSTDRNAPYVPSPLLYDGLLYYARGNSGLLTCADAATGEVHYGPQRLEGVRTLYPSPISAAGRVYVTGKEGLTYVIERGPAFKVLARNQLDDRFTASAAAVGGELLLRGERHLYCIARDSAD